MNVVQRKNQICPTNVRPEAREAKRRSYFDFSETEFIFSILSSAVAFLFTFSAIGKSKARPAGHIN